MRSPTKTSRPVTRSAATEAPARPRASINALRRGRLLDLMVTGDVARVQAAVVMVADRLEAELAALVPSA